MSHTGTASCVRHIVRVNSWEWVRLVFFGRVIPGLIFAYLAWNQIVAARTSLGWIRPGHLVEDFWLRAAPTIFYSPYAVICTLIYLSRPAPHARDSRLIAWMAAFAGTLFINLVGSYAPPGPQLYTLPVWSGYLVTPILIIAIILAVTSVAFLRHSLSIVPEARRVVRTGPYRYVRHPLYLAELTGVGVVILAGGRTVLLIALIAEIWLQYTRARLEERLLRATFPEYQAYAAQTKAIIPGLI